MAKKNKSKPKQTSKNMIAAKKTPAGFCFWEGNVLVLNVLGTPSAKTDKIGKPKGNQLKISVKAAPRAGKATDYMVHFLSDVFDVKTSAIDVVFGRMNINKQLRITAPQQLPSVIERFLAKKS